MRGVIHLKHSQDRSTLPGGDGCVSIGSVMSGTTGAGNAIVTERGHMTMPQPDTSDA